MIKNDIDKQIELLNLTIINQNRRIIRMNDLLLRWMSTVIIPEFYEQLIHETNEQLIGGDFNGLPEKGIKKRNKKDEI